MGYTIVVDTHEQESDLYKELRKIANDDVVKIKGADGYDPMGDYIIIDKNNDRWGIERKSFLDCWNSIIDDRVYGQLCELKEEFGDRAIFLLEAPTHFPNTLRGKEKEIIKSVLSFFNYRSIMMPCWYFPDPQFGAGYMDRFAKRCHNMEIYGRGVTVTVE